MDDLVWAISIHIWNLTIPAMSVGLSRKWLGKHEVVGLAPLLRRRRISSGSLV